MQNIDLSQNKRISDNQWKFLLSSILIHQGLKVKKFIVKNCDLNDEKIKSIIIGTFLGLRKLLDYESIDQSQMLQGMKMELLDFSDNPSIS